MHQTRLALLLVLSKHHSLCVKYRLRVFQVKKAEKNHWELLLFAYSRKDLAAYFVYSIDCPPRQASD